MKNIVLIGFMGVGKGTVARALYRHANLITIDTDDLIESMEKRKIKEIFEAEGEAYFRNLEQALAQWLSRSVTNCVISTGGGFFKVKNLKEIGTIVLLDSPFEAIYARILAHPQAKRKLAKRPLFRSTEKAQALYDERRPQYLEVADLVVDVTNKGEEEIVKEIVSKLS